MVEILGMASNRGRNLLNIQRHRPAGASLGVVVSNRAEAPILSAAAEQGIPTIAVEREPEEGRFDHEERIIAAIAGYDFDLVCLDGYMRILSGTFLDAVPPTLNVHPSLLPSFPGMDAWGDALAADVTISGCTVHMVTDAVDDDGHVITSAIDAGPIVTQEPVPVYPDDSKEILKERILYDAEFVAYPRAINMIATGAVTLDSSSKSVTRTEDADDRFPSHHLASADRVDMLRYGENPHQAAAVYRDRRDDRPSVVGATSINPEAKALSYNNYNDADAALSLVREFAAPTAAVIKHTNPAGCASAPTIDVAYERALATDPKSAFGGVIALNRPCDRATASAIIDSFKEVVVAPDYTEAAIEVLGERSNLRALAVGPLGQSSEISLHQKDLVGGHLIQEVDTQRVTVDDLDIVTERSPTIEEMDGMCFAWHVVKHVKSNAIVLAHETETVGIGAGQVSRVDAVRLACTKADTDAIGKDALGAVMASDAFFPFPDGVEVAAEAGIKAVIQPGGSKRDDAVIEAADAAGLAMAFTGSRCFRHD